MDDTWCIRSASEADLIRFYQWITVQFEPMEVKPLSAILEMRRTGHYHGLGLWSDEKLIGYMLLAYESQEECVLIDYFAILPNYQNTGWGSLFLQEVRNCMKVPVLLEVEDPDYMGDADSIETAMRRMRFYERNGCVQSSVKLNLYEVDYVILRLNPELNLENTALKDRLDRVYHMFFPEEVYQKRVRYHD
ncbi:MAG: GNAT family N-acetyltransferase [Clostridia bacterium]|nr:GNAT family N-acetyltransferase [Clostridia bacterium]MBQ8972124.1 GNAT family N-acetyltransferase [Clostridia bacterium]